MKKLLLALLLICGNAHAAKMADCILDGAQTTKTFIDFRNANFALHIGGLSNANGIANGTATPRYEYWKPTDYARTKWMLDLYGESVTVVPGTNYPDLSKPANRAAEIRVVLKWCTQIKATGIMVDCIMETAVGQGQYAADLIDELVAAADASTPPLDVMVNTGDPFAASETDPATPWGRINAAAPAEWIQVGIDLTDGRFVLAGFARTNAVINSRVAHGKRIIVGVFDLDGKHAATATGFFNSAVFANPLVFGHYNVSYSSTVNVGLQLPGGKPVVEPSAVKLGLNGDYSALGGTLYAPADNWWNLDVSKAPLDPTSDALIAKIMTLGNGGRLHPDFGGGYGIPYAVVDGSTPLVPMVFDRYASESDYGAPGKPAGYPIPASISSNLNTYLENNGGSDGDRHLLIYDRDNQTLFEMAYVNGLSGAKFSAGDGAVFKLDSNYRRAEGWTSTDAAGLAVLPGLVNANELYGTGPIRHATRCSMSKLNRYVWPASHIGSTDAGAPALGTRLRLKASYVIPANTPAYLVKLFNSWKTYGLIVADRGGTVYIQGILDARWNNGELNPAFHAMHATDFEVIKLGWRP